MTFTCKFTYRDHLTNMIVLKHFRRFNHTTFNAVFFFFQIIIITVDVQSASKIFKWSHPAYKNRNIAQSFKIRKNVPCAEKLHKSSTLVKRAIRSFAIDFHGKRREWKSDALRWKNFWSGALGFEKSSSRRLRADLLNSCPLNASSLVFRLVSCVCVCVCARGTRCSD